MEELIGRRPVVRTWVDNTQALAAVRKGYSKKLRHISRTQGVNIGSMSELLSAPAEMVTAEYVESSRQKGDLFTKGLGADKFATALQMCGLTGTPTEGRSLAGPG